MSDALALHAQSMVVDIHTHPLIYVLLMRKHLGRRHRPALFWNPLRNHIDLPRLREGGVKVFSTTLYGLWNPFKPMDSSGIARAMLASMDRMLRDCGGEIEVARTMGEARAIAGRGKIATFLSLESARGLGAGLNNLYHFASAGVRYITLAHFVPNRVACPSSWPWHRGKGLTAFGRQVVREMNRLGIMADLAHANDESFDDVLAETTLPPLNTHVAPHDFKPIGRNITERQLKVIGERGGLVGLISYPAYLERGLLPRGRMVTMLRMAEWVAERIGPQHLAIGTDMDAPIWTPADFKDVSYMPRLTEGLLARGFSENDVRGILGENALRVFTQCDALVAAAADDEQVKAAAQVFSAGGHAKRPP